MRLNNTKIVVKNNNRSKQRWQWWPLLPLYPYGIKKTIFKELIPGQLWSFEQLQGIYYVAVPVRLTVAKITGGLMLFNTLAPTKEILSNIKKLEQNHGKVKTIILPTASGLEHKIYLPALSRAFPNAQLWICPGQWSFPINLPLDWLGIPSRRTRTLFSDGLPHQDICNWICLGPVNIGLGRFQEISCYHKPSKSLLVTDALVAISSKPPLVFDLDPTPLLFHSRENGEEPLNDSYLAREKGWRRLVLFASFLRPEKLSIPSLKTLISYSFKPGMRNARSHFGLYPFIWEKGWESSADSLIGKKNPLIHIPPVIERLVFPRAKKSYLLWLDEIKSIRDIRWLIPSHYSAPVRFNKYDVIKLIKSIKNRTWAVGSGNWSFLDSVDKYLLSKNVVPEDPISYLKD